MKIKKNLFKLLAISFALSVSFCIPVMAAGQHTDDAGNVFFSNDGIAWSDDVENELFLAGQSVSVYDIAVDNNAFIIGKNVSLSNVKIDGSAFLAGYLVIADSDVGHNIWAAGNTIITNPTNIAKSLKAAGSDVTIEGNYETVAACGEKLYYNAHTSGNVILEGDEIIIGPDATVSGILTVKSTLNPSLPDSCSINELNFIQKEETRTSTPVSSEMISIWILSKLSSCAYWLMAFAILALVFGCIIPGHLEASKNLVLKNPVGMMMCGFLGIVLVPVSILFLSITFVALPLAGLMGIVYLSIIFFCKVFTFASFGRHLFFNKVQKRLHPVAETILAVLPAAIIKEIPVIGSIFGVICFAYTLGYVILSLYNQLHKNKPLVDTTSVEQ